METARQVPGLPVLHQQQQLTPEDCRGHQAERKERRISCHSKDQQVWLPGNDIDESLLSIQGRISR